MVFFKFGKNITYNTWGLKVSKMKMEVTIIPNTVALMHSLLDHIKLLKKLSPTFFRWDKSRRQQSTRLCITLYHVWSLFTLRTFTSLFYWLSTVCPRAWTIVQLAATVHSNSRWYKWQWYICFTDLTPSISSIKVPLISKPANLPTNQPTTLQLYPSIPPNSCDKYWPQNRGPQERSFIILWN